jgi:hypothetical protein
LQSLAFEQLARPALPGSNITQSPALESTQDLSMGTIDFTNAQRHIAPGILLGMISSHIIGLKAGSLATGH